MLNTTGRSGERFVRGHTVNTHQDIHHEPHHCADIETLPESLPPIKQENVISFKVYDNCRQQDCLDEAELGTARSACDQHLRDKHFKEGEIIIAPDTAASVSVEDLRIKRIIIVNKRHNQFKRGYWDIDLEYVFEYFLVFREARGREIGSLKALSTFTKKVSLFGSLGSDIVITTDLFKESGDDSPSLNLEPFALVEAKAVALSAKLVHCRPGLGRSHDHSHAEVAVTIGLFTIIKLFRLVTLIVESRGFTIPRNCQDILPINVCDHFDRMPFPMDVFAPPQRREFEAGISGDIPHGAGHGHGHCHKPCGCQGACQCHVHACTCGNTPCSCRESN
jgi:hypothetical protein